MLKSVILRFKLSSDATQEELSLIREEIISFFKQTSLKPEEVICRKGSIEVIIILGAGALYVADKILGGALEEIGKIFVSWIKEKFGSSSQSNIPLDDKNVEILENGVKEVIEQSKEGLDVLPASKLSPQSEPSLDIFQLFNSHLQSDGEALIIFKSETKGIGFIKTNEKGVKGVKKGGKITEIQSFNSDFYKFDE